MAYTFFWKDGSAGVRKPTDYPHLEEGTDVENSPIKHIPIGPPCPHKSVAACKNKSDANFPP